MDDLISRQAAITLPELRRPNDGGERMSDLMTFPDTVEEFMEEYKVVDTEQIYSNGAEYVPIFRMKQWFEHLPTAEKRGKWIRETGQYYQVLRCDQCGHVTVEQVRNYCPNCGCRMTEE